MDIFGENWKNHREKIVNAWKETIREDDAVIMAGDLSWAMSMESAISDLTMLGTLPGRKIIVRGNHDFWWSTVTKMTAMTHGALARPGKADEGRPDHRDPALPALR